MINLKLFWVLPFKLNQLSCCSFETGYAFNALVIDNMEDPWTKITAQEKLERFCYTGDDRNIRARYIDGELLK